MNSSDLAYKKILEDRMKNINESISKLRKSDEKVFAMHTQIESKIQGLQIEYNKIKKELDEYSEREKLGTTRENAISYFENKYEKKNQKQEEYQERLDELRELKKNVSGYHANKVLDRKIKNLEEKIKDMKQKKVSIVKSQRRIMYPKYKKELKKQRRISLQEGKIQNYESKLKDNEYLRQTINEKSIFAPIANIVYDIKEAKYKRKINRYNEVLNKMQNSGKTSKVLGARVTTIKNKVAEKLRVHNPVTDSLGPSPAM